MHGYRHIEVAKFEITGGVSGHFEYGTKGWRKGHRSSRDLAAGESLNIDPEHMVEIDYVNVDNKVARQEVYFPKGGVITGPSKVYAPVSITPKRLSLENTLPESIYIGKIIFFACMILAIFPGQSALVFTNLTGVLGYILNLASFSIIGFVFLGIFDSVCGLDRFFRYRKAGTALTIKTYRHDTKSA